MGATTVGRDTARAGGAQAAHERAHQERSKTQRAALLEQAEEVAAKLAELMGKLTEVETSPLPGETCREERLRAATAILQMKEPPSQPAPEPEARVRAVAVGVLRTRDSETDSRWQCKVLTCAETCHPLIACQQFRLLSRVWAPNPGGRPLPHACGSKGFPPPHIACGGAGRHGSQQNIHVK